MTMITGALSAYANARAGYCLKQDVKGSPRNGFGSFELWWLPAKFVEVTVNAAQTLQSIDRNIRLDKIVN